MVDTLGILTLAKDYESFFSKVITTSIIAGDIGSAQYGLEQSLRIITMVEHSGTMLTNTQLKELYNLSVNISRGVEYFEDQNTELEKRKLGERLFRVRERLRSEIRW